MPTPFEKSKLRDSARADLARAEYDIQIIGEALKDACRRLRRIANNKGISRVGRRKALESYKAMKRLANFANKVARK